MENSRLDTIEKIIIDNKVSKSLSLELKTELFIELCENPRLPSKTKLQRTFHCIDTVGGNTEYVTIHFIFENNKEIIVALEKLTKDTIVNRLPDSNIDWALDLGIDKMLKTKRQPIIGQP